MKELKVHERVISENEHPLKVVPPKMLSSTPSFMENVLQRIGSTHRIIIVDD